jgi:hypothetical protein
MPGTACRATPLRHARAPLGTSSGSRGSAGGACVAACVRGTGRGARDDGGGATACRLTAWERRSGGCVRRPLELAGVASLAHQHHCMDRITTRGALARYDRARAMISRTHVSTHARARARAPPRAPAARATRKASDIIALVAAATSPVIPSGGWRGFWGV